MAFADTDDIAARLGRDLTVGEATAATLVLEGATAAIAAAADKTDAWAAALDPVPQIIRFVCIEVAARALANPQAVDSWQEGLGAYSQTTRFRRDGGGLILTDTEELLVRRAVYGRLTGSVAIEGHVEQILDETYGS